MLFLLLLEESSTVQQCAPVEKSPSVAVSQYQAQMAQDYYFHSEVKQSANYITNILECCSATDQKPPMLASTKS